MLITFFSILRVQSQDKQIKKAFYNNPDVDFTLVCVIKTKIHRNRGNKKTKKQKNQPEPGTTR